MCRSPLGYLISSKDGRSRTTQDCRKSGCFRNILYLLILVLTFAYCLI